MTATADSAQTTLNDLLDQREAMIARAAKLADERQKIAFAAHTGTDTKAKDRLRKLNDDSVLAQTEIESIDSAIAEAASRVETAKQAEARAADREQAKQLQAALTKFKELGGVLDDCFDDFNSAAKEIKTVLDTIHQCGCAVPSAQLFKVNSSLAFKTAILGTPFWTNEFPVLQYHERKSFRSLVAAWSGAIEAHINARLGETKKEEVA